MVLEIVKLLTRAKIWDVRNSSHVQNLGRAKLLALAKFGTCERFDMCEIWDVNHLEPDVIFW